MAGKANQRELRNIPRVDYREHSDSDSDERTQIERELRDIKVDFREPSDSDSGEQIPIVLSDQPEEMAAIAEAKIAGQLTGLLFQVEEITDELVDFSGVSKEDLQAYHDELKQLRVDIVQVSASLRALRQGAALENEAVIISSLDAAKTKITQLKSAIAQGNTLNDTKEAVKEDQEKRARRFVYDTVLDEIDTIASNLKDKYAVSTDDNENLSVNKILKRKEMKDKYAVEHDRLRKLLDRLLDFTDVCYDSKEMIINNKVREMKAIDGLREEFEDMLRMDLDLYDLTDQKMKLATQTKIDIGKFSGEIGEDFYTFKTKFEGAYQSHPRKLKVEWLKNNHLSGKAKDCIGSLDELDKIWDRLKDNFGNTEQLLQYHFGKINKLGQLSRQRSYSSKQFYIQDLINAMQDVKTLALEHGLDGELSYGPQLGKIVLLLENHQQNAWYKLITEDHVKKPDQWNRMVKFLQNQLCIFQVRAASETTEGSSSNDTPKKPDPKKSGAGNNTVFAAGKEKCTLCDLVHPNANNTLFHCRKFLTMTIKQRGFHVRKKQLCMQCLDSKTKWKDPAHVCSDKWVCDDESHAGHEKKLHFLLCATHTEREENKKLFEDFKKEILESEWQKNIFKDKSYLVRPPATYLKRNDAQKKPKAEDIIDATSEGPAIFLLQPVSFNNKVFNFMYDSGCGNFVCRQGALDKLPDDCKENVIPGPIVIRGVGDNQVISQHGHWSVKFPIHTGQFARFSGVSLDVVTGTMPPYPVREASKSVVDAFVAQGGKASDLPSIPVLVGGDTDFLIGIQYNYFQPRLIHMLPSGFGIYESMFQGIDGTRGCVGGPHSYFLQVEQQFTEFTNGVNFRTFLARQIELFNNGLRVCLDHDVLKPNRASSADNKGADVVSPLEEVKNLTNILQKSDALAKRMSSLQVCNLQVVGEENLGQKPIVLSLSKIKSAIEADETRNAIKCHCVHCPEPVVLSLSKITKAIEADKTGSNLDYRCVKCRNCPHCKNGEKLEKVSLREEYEQSLIDDSVTVDLENGVSSATLPFLSDPQEKLADNKDIALRIYKQQLKKLDKKPEVKKAVLEFEQKLQDSQYVDYVANLSPSQKELLSAPGVMHYLPWRHVHNENSVTTSTRIVFDGSSITGSGECLNGLLPKGINHLVPLLQIFIRWRSWPIAMHTDAKKMYNTIKLASQFWRYQLYLWDPKLDLCNEPTIKVIKTLIYGVRSSGNQAQVALRTTAERQRDKYPEAAKRVIEDTYADDNATGTISHENADQLEADITDLVAGGGFALKGFTRSGRPPLPSLSKDGVSINVAGTKWLSEKDVIKLDVGPLNFSKKCRGKKEIMQSEIPKKLTKRICSSKALEIYDLTGLILPITIGFKIDVHDLHVSSFGWDDPLPLAEREKWIKNFEVMEQVEELEWQRAVIPPDAKSLQMELIGAGDASEKIACAGCYVRFECKDGTYSSQLILAKSKIVDGTTIPRAELIAATLNTHTVEIVKKALKDRVTNCAYVLDSEIALHWIASQTKPLKPLVRNNVIEINRFTGIKDWFHLDSDENPVDVATRKGASMNDVKMFNFGKNWMEKSIEELVGSVLRTVEDVKLQAQQLAEILKEQIKPGSDLCLSNYHLFLPKTEGEEISTDASTVCLMSELTKTIEERLRFSRYLINPNKFAFSKVLRITGIVISVSKIWLSKIRRCLTRFSAGDSAEVSTIQVDQTTSKLFAILTDADIQYSKNYFFLKATEELKSFAHPKHYEKFAEERDGILYFVGRVMHSDFSFASDYSEKMLDLTTKSFVVPIVDSKSPLAYSIVNDVHWNDPDAKHRGVETTIRAVMSIAYIINVRDIAKLFRKKCQRCRYILKRTVEVLMGPTSKDNLCIAPPFYITQVDICGPFTSYSTHNKRSTKKVWMLVFVCSTTGCTSIKIMEECDTVQFLLAFVRFACDLGYPKKLLIDEGSQLISGCENIVLNMSNLKGQLNKEYGIEFDTCPVGGHNFHGRVERKIRSVRETMERSMKGHRLSVIEWETVCAEIANTVNNMPIAIGNETEDLENLDIITPNRLRLARNNNRSPVGPLEVSSKIDRLLSLRHDAFEAWWEAWLVSTMPKLVPQPKWFRNDQNLQKGDIVLFNKSEASLIGEYKYGIVEEVRMSADNNARSVVVKYKNANEAVFRTTVRAVRTLVVIHRVDEVDLMEEVGAATYIIQ